MKKFLLLILLSITFFGFAQETPKEFRFNSMTDHTSFEETQMFGKLDTSLPLYTITLPNFNFPILLSYNQDGNVRHNVQGGQFGDAWDLNIVGTITRKVREIKVAAKHSKMNLVKGHPDLGEVLSIEVDIETLDYENYVTDELYYLNNSTERPDDQRDVFQFNVLGLSGKFFVKRKASGGLEAKILESSDYCNIGIIANANYEITSFEVTDKYGYKYVLDNESNINQNINYTVISGPTVRSLINSSLSYYPSFYKPLYELNPAANSSSNTNDKEIVYAQLKNGTDFWENMNLSKIYDKDGNLLLTLTYEEDPVFWIDHTFSFTSQSGYRLTKQALLKDIAVVGKGKLHFENSGMSSSSSRLITKKLEVKDLKNNLIKEISFSYKYPNRTINTREHQKRLLEKITEFSSLSIPFTTQLYYKEEITAPNNIFDIQHKLGYITKGYYKYGYLNSESFAADLFSLQKIKYPTGGTVLYKFGQNTSKNMFPSTDFLKNNMDNQILTNLTVSSVSNNYYFTVDENDLVFITPSAGDSRNCQLYKAVNGQSVLVTSFTYNSKYDATSNFKRGLTLYDNPYDWPFYQKLDPGSYMLTLNIATPQLYVKKMNYKTGSGIKNYVNVEGMRIEEIAYFNGDVAQNLLDQGNSTDAEKYTRFDYSGDETNSSSGSVFNDYRIQRPLFSDSHVFYGQIATNNRGIGKRTNKYITLPNVRPAFKKVVKTSLYDNAGSLLKETVYDRVTQSYTPIEYISDFNMIVSPYEIQINQTDKNYEGGSYIQTTSQQNYETLYRQLSSSVSEDNLGKTTKAEFDYNAINNKVVNTQVHNYVNNSLTDQISKSYDWLGNATETKFKTPEMSAFEDTGATNYYYHNGLLQGYTQLDGTPVTFIYGYNETQLVAKMVNVSATVYYATPGYGSIRSNIEIQSNQAVTGYSEVNLKTTLNSLRTTFPNAQVITYTYKPMVGVSSVTDENGNITTYEYDSYNRLTTVKDYLGNILKEYQYNFTN